MKAIGRSEIKRKFNVTTRIEPTNVSIKVKQCPIVKLYLAIDQRTT